MVRQQNGAVRVSNRTGASGASGGYVLLFFLHHLFPDIIFFPNNIFWTTFSWQHDFFFLTTFIFSGQLLYFFLDQTFFFILTNNISYFSRHQFFPRTTLGRACRVISPFQTGPKYGLTMRWRHWKTTKALPSPCEFGWSTTIPTCLNF